jgi:hypothetical protein
MAQRGDQGAGVAAPGVQRDRADLGQPAARPGSKPAVHRSLGPVGHQVQQAAAFQVDQAGDPPGRCCPGRPEETGLVQAERGHTLQRVGSSTSGVLRDTLDEDDGDTLDGDEPGRLVTMIVSPSSR